MPDSPVTTCFIDTNIWLYAFIEADDTAKSATARTLIQESEIVASALSAGVSILYSEDLQHGLIIEEQLQVLNPFVQR